MISDKRKIKILKDKIKLLRSVLESEGIDSSACLMGGCIDGPSLKHEEAKWILKEYQAGRI